MPRGDLMSEIFHCSGHGNVGKKAEEEKGKKKTKTPNFKVPLEQKGMGK